MDQRDREEEATSRPSAPPSRPLWQRLAWLVVIWAGSVLTLTVVAYLLRLIMTAAGLSTPD